MLGSKKGMWVVLAGVLYSAAAFAQTTATSELRIKELEPRRAFDWSGRYSFDLGGGHWSQNKDIASTAYVYVSSDFNFKFSDTLRAKISPWGRFFSGRSQERYDDDDLQTRISLHDFYLAYEPVSFAELKLGGHAQSVLRTPMLVSNLRTFPGVQTALKADFDRENRGSVMYQRLIPTSHSVNSERIEAEPLPSFETVHAEVQGGRQGLFKYEARVGHFAWADIPSKVAYESRKLGNWGYGESVPESKLAFSHKGWFGGGAFCLCLGKTVDVIAEYSRIHNTEAPANSADAQLVGIGPKFNWAGKELDLRYRQVFIEPEATIAAYSRSRFGNTNRIGHNVEASLKFANAGFSLYAEMFRMKPLNVDLEQNQGILEEYFIGVETDYVSF